jgi:hypothetical protein
MNLIRKLGLVIVAFGSVSVAQGDPIVHLFSGEIVEVEYSGADPFGGSIVTGTSFSGGYLFDTDAQPKDGDACDLGFQCYWEFDVPPDQFIYSVGGILGAATGPDLSIIVTDNNVAIGGLTGGDAITISSEDNGAIFGGFEDSVVQISFIDLTGLALDDPSILPVTAPDLNDFTLRPFPEFIPASFNVYGDWGAIHGEIGWIQDFPKQVPEPGTLALFAIGLAGMRLARRRQR